MMLDCSRTFDVVVVGGGSAGLAAACAAEESGARDVIVVEREEYLGGVLPQCVHDGFGLHLYGESLTGPEYAQMWVARALSDRIEAVLATTVVGVRMDRTGRFFVEAVGQPLGGRAVLTARSVVVATGCRERTRGALQIPGSRPAGVLTAGSAQYMVNVANQMPGDKVVVLGSGDIGLIMARRMTLEGAEVRLVLGQEATGLVRNHIRCIQDFGIPFRYGWGLVSVHGIGQLKGVTVAPLREDGTFDKPAREYVRCNTLLVACGLVPEREVLAGVSGAGEADGLFVCGNAHIPHDLVDQVTQEGIRAGLRAAAFAMEDRGGAVKEPADLARMERRAVREPSGKMADVCDVSSEGACRIVCTVCPTGCVMEARCDGSVLGNACPRGKEYALCELACPLRLFTGTVKVSGGGARRLLPVKTACEVPRSKLFDVARACRRVLVEPPVRVGDVVLPDVAGTGVALVATASVGELSYA